MLYYGPHPQCIFLYMNQFYFLSNDSCIWRQIFVPTAQKERRAFQVNPFVQSVIIHIIVLCSSCLQKNFNSALAFHLRCHLCMKTSFLTSVSHINVLFTILLKIMFLCPDFSKIAEMLTFGSVLTTFQILD